MPVDVPALLDWYASVRRPLPWRFTSDPWAILVCEVMCQQTQAERVIPFWERWLDRFPGPEDCAAAEPADVLALWSGLGYNRRGLALQAAAARVAADGWPRTATALQRLPGVGPYTAAAVASFAFGEPVPTVDTNWRRVVGRAGSEPVPADPAREQATLNQAMMELGATICTARAPRCDVCPIRPGCAAAAAGGPVIAARAPRGTRVRFEDTDRFLRGRVVAALLAGNALPPAANRVIGGLERDGLVVRRADGGIGLPHRDPERAARSGRRRSTAG